MEHPTNLSGTHFSDTGEPSGPVPLNSKICIVTGGTRGIGRAVAKMLAAEGASVVICGRTAETTEQAAAELSAESGNKVKGKAADVSKHEDVGELFRFTVAAFGGVDVLVNNAGVGVFRPVGELSIEEWKLTVETNLYGAFFCSREALSRFETRGGGHIVNISSLAGANAFAGGTAYNASKFALNGFTEAMMQDLRSRNVRVSYIMPGSVATAFGGQATGTADGSDWKILPQDIAETVRTVLAMPVRTLISRVEIRPFRPKR